MQAQAFPELCLVSKSLAQVLYSHGILWSLLPKPALGWLTVCRGDRERMKTGGGHFGMETWQQL